MMSRRRPSIFTVRKSLSALARVSSSFPLSILRNPHVARGLEKVSWARRQSTDAAQMTAAAADSHYEQQDIISYRGHWIDGKGHQPHTPASVGGAPYFPSGNQHNGNCVNSMVPARNQTMDDVRVCAPKIQSPELFSPPVSEEPVSEDKQYLGEFHQNRTASPAGNENPQGFQQLMENQQPFYMSSNQPGPSGYPATVGVNGRFGCGDSQHVPPPNSVQGQKNFHSERHAEFLQNPVGYNRNNSSEFQQEHVAAQGEEQRGGSPVGSNAKIESNEENSSFFGTIDELDASLKEGNVEDAVAVLELLEKKGIVVDLSRYHQLIQACGDTKSLKEAKIVHEHVMKVMTRYEIKVCNKMLEMYCKCSSVDDARKLFESMPERNLTSWEMMILCLTDNGLAEEAIDLFTDFKQKGLRPDGYIFNTLFHVCGVLGDVDEGMLHFESMKKDYGITPETEHYAGVVGMFGATGYLDEAWEFIETMPIEPSILVWETLMNHCRVHGNVELGDRCAAIVENLDSSRLTHESKSGLVPVKPSDLVKKGKKKSDSLGVRTRLHEYRAGDQSHPESDKIYALIWKLAPQMREAGYVPETRFVLHDVEQESKEEALLYHSERLATAYGLITSATRTPIRIIKNLRICGDCHNAMKILSKLVGRQLIMRDAKRFHHFENGVCSCRDYW